MTTFTAGDFAKARFATRGNHCASRLAQGQGGPMWTTAGGAEFTDGDMARCGWVPVREASGKREPWADLAYLLKAWDAGESALDVDVEIMARWLHERGVRAVTGGDES